MINLEEQISLFKNVIGTQLKRRVECIAIGGSAMMFYQAKNTTKDVDLVFLKKEDLEEVKEILFNSGFNERKNIQGIFREDEDSSKPVMMESPETRFDLFLDEVIGFKIHQSTIERLREVHEFGKFIVKAASPEDILMMKGCTERLRDRDDAAELVKRVNIDWKVIISETSAQTKIGMVAFPLLLYEFLTELKENYKIDVPKDITKELLAIAEKQFKELKKKGQLVKVTKYRFKK
ncbi:nucleotidyltransferase [Candidatus Woesearchaeota archaeon]|nr:nucleotidyltransferase [Candidatus Woesearchaeota archaeon]